MRFWLLIVVAIGLQLGPSASAAIRVVENFSDAASTTFSPWSGTWVSSGTDQFTQSVGFISILPVLGGDPRGDGAFDGTIDSAPADLSSGFDSIRLTLRLDAGSTTTSFAVSLRDSSFNVAAQAVFLASDFSLGTFVAVSEPWSLGAGDLSDVTYYSVAADGNAASAVRVSLDEIAAVPEPSATLLLAGAGAFLLKRRRGVR